MLSSFALLFALAAQGPPAPDAGAMRTVSIGAFTKKGAPVEDLAAAEVTVKEDGEKRPVASVERDQRPLDVAVVVDSSAAVAGVYRSELVSAVLGFWKSLPAGASVAVFTSGPPSLVVDFGTDSAAAEPVLQKVACSGKSYAFEAIADAGRALAARPASRRALVFVGSSGIESSQARTAEAMQGIGQAQATPMVVLLTAIGGAGTGLGGPTAGMSSAWDVEGFFKKMAEAYGGAFTSVLSAQAASKVLATAAADLTAQYRVRYESRGAATATTVSVGRKDVKVRTGRPQKVSKEIIGIR
jgi:hypothetical protein